MSKYLFIIIILLLAGYTAKAQVGINTENPTPNSALQVVSTPGHTTQQGVLMPTITTDSLNDIEMPNLKLIDEIVIDENTPAIGVNNSGLIIFNQKSGCFNYWNSEKQQWWSICGTMPMADASIENCAGIKVIGLYLEKQAFSINNYLQIPITVSKPGTYSITTEMTDPAGGNGYYFTTKGVFPNTGTFMVNVPGVGTPETFGENHIKIYINGKEQSCDVLIKIIPNDPDYCIIDVQQLSPSWPIMTDLANNQKYQLQVTLLVNNPGKWEVTTSTVNGYSFYGTGEIAAAQGFNPTGTFPQNVKVLVPVADGQANLYGSGVDNFVLSTMTSKNPCNSPFAVSLAKGGFEINSYSCGMVIMHGLDSILYEGRTIVVDGVDDPYIEFPITVISPATLLVEANVAGMDFASGTGTYPYTPSPIDITWSTTLIRLYPVSTTPTASGVFNTPIPVELFTDPGPSFATRDNGYIGAGSCANLSVTVKPSVAQFSSITLNRYIGGVDGQTGFYLVNSLVNGGVNVPVTAIVLNVNVTERGDLDLSSTLNGITYSYSGTVTPADTEITLTYSGDTPQDFGKMNYTFKYYKPGDALNNPTGVVLAPIYFGYRQMNIVSYGDATYTLNRNPSAGKAIIESPDNFGPTGEMPSLGFTVQSYTAVPNAPTMRTQLADADVVFVGYPDGFGVNALIDVLKEFNDAGGVVIYSSQNFNFSQYFYQAFYGSSITVAPVIGGLRNLPIGTRTTTELIPLPDDDPIVNGIFSTNAGTLPPDITYPPTRIVPQRMGAESANACYTNNQTLAPTIIPLSRVQGNGNDYIFAWYDPTKGIMYFGDSGWTRGETSGTAAVIASSTSPNRAAYPIDGRSNFVAGTVLSSGVNEPAGLSQNSYIFANAVAWAMNYAAKNRVR